MHETAIADSLLQTILKEAEKQTGKPVKAKVSCGILNAVNDDLLNFAFEALAKDTPCQSMTIEVDHKPIRAKCRKCGNEFAFEINKPICDNCGSEDYDLLPDEPLILESIEFESE